MLMVFEKRPHFFGGLLPRALTAVALVSVLPLISSAQPSPGVFGPGPGCNLFPAPPSVGATVGPELGRPCPIAQIRPGGYRQRNRHIGLFIGVPWLPATGLYGTFCPMSATLRSRRSWD